MPDGSHLSATETIRSLDLDWIADRLKRDFGFDDARAARAIRHYRFVLELALEFPDRAIAPPAGADRAWHVHMLHTQRYVADCQLAFGEYIHHDPEACGTPAFWAAWDFTREKFAERLGVTLAESAQVPGAHPDDMPIRTDPRDAEGTVDPDNRPMECVLMARQEAADNRPMECVLMPRRPAA